MLTSCLKHLCEGCAFVSTELGKVKRNCTEFGWSETFPHYIDACLYEEGNSSHVVSASVCGAVWDTLSDVSVLRNKLCSMCVPCLGCRCRTCTTCRWRLCTLWATAPLWSLSPWPWSSCAGSGETRQYNECFHAQLGGLSLMNYNLLLLIISLACDYVYSTVL